MKKMLLRFTRKTFKPGRSVLAPLRTSPTSPAKNGSLQICNRSDSRRSCLQSLSPLERRMKRKINSSSKRMLNERREVTSKSWTYLKCRIPQYWNMILWRGLATINLLYPESTASHNCPDRAAGQSVSSQSSTRAKPSNKRNQPATSFLTLAKSWWPKFRFQTKPRKQNCWKSTSLWRRRNSTMGKRRLRKTRTNTRSIKWSFRISQMKLRSKSGKSSSVECNCRMTWII